LLSHRQATPRGAWHHNIPMRFCYEFIGGINNGLRDLRNNLIADCFIGLRSPLRFGVQTLSAAPHKMGRGADRHGFRPPHDMGDVVSRTVAVRPDRARWKATAPPCCDHRRSRQVGRKVPLGATSAAASTSGWNTPSRGRTIPVGEGLRCSQSERPHPNPGPHAGFARYPTAARGGRRHRPSGSWRTNPPSSS